MRLLFLDIEATRNDLPWSPRMDNAEAFAPPPCWDIVCIGSMVLDIERDPGGNAESGDPPTFSARARLGAFQHDVREAIRSVEKVAHTAQIVTYNGRGFDLPVIESTAIRLGVPAPSLFGKALRGRYDDGHLDLMDWIANFGASKPVSLDLACRAAGLPGKGEHSGADVAAMVTAGRIDEVRTYCLSDVAQLGLLHTAVSVATGWLTKPLAELVEAEIWRAVEAVPGLEWMLDCPRFRGRREA